MNMIPKILCLCGCLWAVPAFAGSEEDSTLVKTGQTAPEFSVTTVDGKTFDLKDARDKVVLVNFFATWCGPCMQEIPHLQDQIWDRFKGSNFVMVAIDREEKPQVVADFQKQRGFTFPIASDPKREVYAKFATQYIPRNFLIDASGKVVFQSAGYTPAEFQKLVELIQQETAKVK